LIFNLIALSLSDSSAASCSTSVSPGVLTYTYGGTSTPGYIIQAGGTGSGEWGPVTPSSSQVTIGMGPRFYISNTCQSAFSSSVFKSFNPLGSTISFTVNLSNAGCGTDASFYLVGMPASAAGSNGDYYCDANCVGGSCCTEFDLMEANRHALQITAHHCSSLTSGCDGGGCALNTQSISNGFGPSSSFTINTENVFTVSITFSASPLSTVTSVISQGSNKITLTHSSSNCGSGYLSEMDQAFQNGMVPVWSYWSGSMSWLDSPACSSDTDEFSSPSFIFSNLAITNAGAVAPPPPPPPPPPPGTLTCGTSGCTINAYWVEFTAPSSGTSPSTATATVKCGTGSTVVGSTVSCTWYAAGSKFQCNPGSNECLAPEPYYNGSPCPYATAQAESSDATAQTFNGLSVATIAGIAVGCIVGVALLIAIIVLALKKKQKEEYV